jgi:hypothetical protein
MLIRCGGKDVAKGVAKMMHACVTHKAACNYTLLGRHKTKKGFCNLPLYRVIIRKYCPYSSFSFMTFLMYFCVGVLIADWCYSDKLSVVTHAPESAV